MTLYETNEEQRKLYSVFSLYGFVSGVIEYNTAGAVGPSFVFVAACLLMGLAGCIAGPLILYRYFRILKEEKEALARESNA